MDFLEDFSKDPEVAKRRQGNMLIARCLSPKIVLDIS